MRRSVNNNKRKASKAKGAPIHCHKGRGSGESDSSDSDDEFLATSSSSSSASSEKEEEEEGDWSESETPTVGKKKQRVTPAPLKQASGGGGGGGGVPQVPTRKGKLAASAFAPDGTAVVYDRHAPPKPTTRVRVDGVVWHHCRFCEYGTKLKGHLTRHEAAHLGDKPFECQYCDAAFRQKSHLVNHERTHTMEKPFECQYCDAAFTERGHLAKHERTHTGEKPYGCGECDARFTQRGHLVAHARTHSGTKPYLCSACDYATAQRYAVTRHIKAKHPGTGAVAINATGVLEGPGDEGSAFRVASAVGGTYNKPPASAAAGEVVAATGLRCLQPLPPATDQAAPDTHPRLGGENTGASRPLAHSAGVSLVAALSVPRHDAILTCRPSTSKAKRPGTGAVTINATRLLESVRAGPVPTAGATLVGAAIYAVARPHTPQPPSPVDPSATLHHHHDGDVGPTPSDLDVDAPGLFVRGSLLRLLHASPEQQALLLATEEYKHLREGSKH